MHPMQRSTSSNTPQTSISRTDTFGGDEPSPSYALGVSHQRYTAMHVAARLDWKIDKFERVSALTKNAVSIVSERFCAPAAPRIVWELHVYPNGKREEDNGNYSFFLRQVAPNLVEPVMADFQIYVVDVHGAHQSVCRDAKEFTINQGRGKFQVSKERILQYVQTDGSLHLRCDVEYIPSDMNRSEVIKPCWEMTQDKLEMLKNRMQALYNDDTFTDIEIHVDSQIFRAHKAVLAQSSDVFRSMFNMEMKERNAGQLHITDCSGAAVKGMIEFVYMGTVSQQLFLRNAKDLLIIAEKYNIQQLKTECENHLAKDVNSKTFYFYVQFADIYNSEVLMAECRRYLLYNYEQLTSSAEWRELKTTHKTIVNNLLEKVLQEKILNNIYVKAECSSSHCSSMSSSMNPLSSDEPVSKRPRRRCTAQNTGS